jgi:hypothetical protein
MIPPVSLSVLELQRINRYYDALRRPMLTNVNNNQGPAQPPSGGASGNGNGQEGAGSGPGVGPVGGGAPGNDSEPARSGWESLLCCRRQEQGLAAGREESMAKQSFNGPPILTLEGVDEDAQDADATTKDELMLLAHSSELWAGELAKYLQAERNERDEVHRRRMARLEDWMQDVVPTL